MNFEPMLPKYAQLIDIIKTKIETHDLLPDAQLPTEDELAAQYDMSRGTVRKAIHELQQMGFVRKEQGRGTFVNGTSPMLSGFSLVDFDQYMRQRNRHPVTTTLCFETVSAPSDVADDLAIAAEMPVFHLVQLRHVDSKPIVREERYFPVVLCADLTREAIDQHGIHWLLIEKYGIPMTRLTHDIHMTTLPEDFRALFNVEDTVSIFEVTRLSYTGQGDAMQPAVWYHALYRADEYQFQAQFKTSI